MPNVRIVRELKLGKKVKVVHELFTHDTSVGMITGYTTDVYSATLVKHNDSGESALVFTPTERNKPAVFVPAQAVNEITVFKNVVPGVRTVFRSYPRLQENS
jgi:hypothetical protein